MTGSSYFPVFLDLRGRRCVVFGDTAVAREKVIALRGAGADVVHLERSFRAGDFAGAHLAVDASGDASAHLAVRTEADVERVLLNVVDVADRCDWIAPAVVRRGSLQVAISTSSESPFLASAVRVHIEALLGGEWARFTGMVGRARRRLRGRGVPREEQRRVYQRLLRSQVRELLRAGEVTAAESLATSIESTAYRADSTPAWGEVVLVGAGPGDPALLTVAAREVLVDADVVFHDSLVDRSVLCLCGAHARIVNVGKRAGRASTAQAGVNDAMIASARSGNLVVRLKGGDPFVFGRGGEEVNALTEAGIPVRVIPGLSAALAAPAAAGIPVTHRGVAGSVAIVSGHRAGGDAGADIERLARAADTLVVLMPGDVDALAARLATAVGGGRPAALVSGATGRHERVVRATAATIGAAARAAGIGPPATLVVGEVVNVVTALDEEARSLALS